MKVCTTLLFCLFYSSFAFSQQQIFQDNFESASASGGIRTPEGSGGTGQDVYTSYFTLTDGLNISQVTGFTLKQGTNYWAGEDHNATGTGLPSAGAATDDINNELSITWTGINITNRTNLLFKGLFAANSTSQAWDNKIACASGQPSTNTDYIIVQYRIDAGTWKDLLRFFTKGQANGTGLTWRNLYEDTGTDGCGDGTMLTNVFGEFSKTFSGTGNTLDIRINVSCEGNAEEWGIDNFRVIDQNPFPVNLVHFDGQNGPDGNKLKWTTTGEKNNKGFQIERSADGKGFETIGFVDGLGTSASRQFYSFTDTKPLKETSYYRLKQIDFDGSSEYSRLVAVKFNLDLKLKLYPNPVVGTLTLDPGELASSDFKIEVIDAVGRVVPVHFRKNGILWESNIKSLPRGTYLIKIVSNGQVVSRSVFKQ